MSEKNYSGLIERAKNGDKTALEEIYTSCYAFLVFICKPLCDSREDMEEVVQDTFLRAFRKLDQLKDPAAFLPWLQKIAINMCYRKYNRSKKREEALVYAEDLSNIDVAELNKEFLPENFFEDNEKQKELFSMIAALPKVQKKMVYLYYYVGLNTTEIAKVHGCTDGAVRNSLFTAKNTIKEKIQSDRATSAAFVPLGAIFSAQEVAFTAEYTAINTLYIKSTAEVVIAAATKSVFLSKVAICSYTLVCVAVAGLVTAGIYNNIRTLEYPDIRFDAGYAIAEQEYLSEPISSIEQEGAEDIYVSDGNVVADEVQDSDYIERYSAVYIDADTDAQYLDVGLAYSYSEANFQNNYPAQTPYEQYSETEQGAEHEVIPDRTVSILAALSAAQTESSVINIIGRYEFSHLTRWQGFLGEVMRFYYTNEGSGDILIGTGKYEDEWFMKFQFFEGSSINMQAPELIRWLEQ